MKSADVSGDDYVLGTDRVELDRLRLQHTVWTQQAFAVWARAGLKDGDAVLDLGCGPGYTSFDLADLVGPAGRVLALDRSTAFIDYLRSECRARAIAQLEARVGDATQLKLPPASFDAVYSRWLLCWLPDAGSVLRELARCVKPGGVVVAQEYLDWGALKLVPDSAIMRRMVEACLQSFRTAGATINVSETLVASAASAGFDIESFRPVARLGSVGSLEWRWLSQFFASYLPRLVQRGQLTQTQFDAWRDEWSARAADGHSFCYTPTMADLILRKPNANND